MKKRFKEILPRFMTNAELATAETAKDYATIYRNFFDRVPGLFQHAGCTYYSFLKQKGDDPSLIIERCGRFTLKVISYFKDTSNPDHPEYRYNLQITPKGGRPIKATANGRDLATPRGIKEFFLTRAKVSYEAGSSSCTALATMITSAKKAPEVLQLSLTGYDVSSRWYVLKYFAIDPAEKLHHPDKRGLYKTSFNGWVIPPAHAAEKAIKPATTGPTVKDIHSMITAAWAENGAAALAFACCSWFVNQIKSAIGFCPILSMSGDPGAGKSALTIIMNALQGVDDEGIAINSLGTKKGFMRSISGRSGMFTSVLENNERNDRIFDFSFFLTAYNRADAAKQANFSNDNRVKTTSFLGALVSVQNTEPWATKAEKERVISLHFDHASLTDETRAAYEQLCKTSLPELARVMVVTLQQRTAFEKGWLEAYHQAIEDLSPMDNRRILQNHALVLAFHRLFCRIHKIECDLTGFMKAIAEEKCISSAVKDYNLADHFFDLIDNIDEEKTASCLHLDAKKRLIYISLSGMEQLIRNRGIQFSFNDYLSKALTSHPAFIENSKRHRFPLDPETDSRGLPKQRRSWVFDANRFE